MTIQETQIKPSNSSLPGSYGAWQWYLFVVTKQESEEDSQAPRVSRWDNLITKNLFHPVKSSVSRLLHDFKEILDSNRNTWFNILHLHCLVEILKSCMSSIFVFCLKMHFITNKVIHLLKHRNCKCHYTKSYNMISDLLKQSEKCRWCKFKTAVPEDWFISVLVLLEGYFAESIYTFSAIYFLDGNVVVLHISLSYTVTFRKFPLPASCFMEGILSSMRCYTIWIASINV